MEAVLMAKKPASKKAASAVRKPVVVTIKASADWKEWLEGLSNHLRSDVAKTIDRALIQLAKTEGYDREAPQR